MRYKPTTVKMEGKSDDLTVVCEGDIPSNRCITMRPVLFLKQIKREFIELLNPFN